MKWLWIALAGAAGTLARYWLGAGIQRLAGGSFPWGTVVINVSGCFVFGLFWALAVERFNIDSELRIIILLGFMGAFTTFSTYMFESVDLLRAGAMFHALLNLLGQNLAGFIAVLAGMALARVLG